MGNEKRNHSKYISVSYRGNGHTTGEPIVGKLSFSAEPDGNGARIAVLFEDCTDAQRDALCDDPSTVALLFVGDTPPSPLVRVATERALPMLSLDALPASCEGAIAILDTAAGILTVHPDLDALSRYAGRTRREEIAPLPPPPTNCLPASPHGEPGYLFPCPIREESEDGLFESYRDALEAASPTPLFFVFSANLTHEERESHLRALLRAAVFGRLTVLHEGVLSPHAWHALTAEWERTYRALQREEREVNRPATGLWIASPLSLFALPTLPPVAHLGLDLPRLFPASLGDLPRDDETRRAFTSLLSACLSGRTCPRSARLSHALEPLFSNEHLRTLGIEIRFLPS